MSEHHRKYGSGPGSEHYQQYGSKEGSQHYHDYGSGRGSKHYEGYGSGPGSDHYWEYGSDAGSQHYWEYGSGPGSKHYWEYGSGPGSKHYWEYGAEQRLRCSSGFFARSVRSDPLDCTSIAGVEVKNGCQRRRRSHHAEQRRHRTMHQVPVGPQGFPVGRWQVIRNNFGRKSMLWWMRTSPVAQGRSSPVAE